MRRTLPELWTETLENTSAAVRRRFWGDPKDAVFVGDLVSVPAPHSPTCGGTVASSGPSEEVGFVTDIDGPTKGATRMIRVRTEDNVERLYAPSVVTRRTIFGTALSWWSRWKSRISIAPWLVDVGWRIFLRGLRGEILSFYVYHPVAVDVWLDCALGFLLRNSTLVRTKLMELPNVDFSKIECLDVSWGPLRYEQGDVSPFRALMTIDYVLGISGAPVLEVQVHALLSCFKSTPHPTRTPVGLRCGDAVLTVTAVIGKGATESALWPLTRASVEQRRIKNVTLVPEGTDEIQEDEKSGRLPDDVTPTEIDPRRHRP